MNFVHKFNNICALYSLSYHFLKKIFARYARSIDCVLSPLRNESNQACNELYQLHL